MRRLLPPGRDDLPVEWERVRLGAAALVFVLVATAYWLPGFGAVAMVVPDVPGLGLLLGVLASVVRALLGLGAAALVWWGVRNPYPPALLALVPLPAVALLEVPMPFAVLAVLGALVVVAAWRRPSASVVLAVVGALVAWWWVSTATSMAAPFSSYVELRYTEPLLVGALYSVAFLAVLAGGLGARALVEREQGRRQLLARSDEVEEQSAVVAERARLALDLHDVVAHHVSLIAVRAETAPYVHPDLQPQARVVLAEIASDARLALDELRGVLGILHRADGGARSPQPGWTDVDALVERSRGAGTDVALRGDLAAPVPASVGYAAYRVVQEALTNARRHAPGAGVTVTMSVGPHAVTVVVQNALLPSGPERAGSGRGLAGMRERVEGLGGRLTVGPRGEEFVVEAVLPGERGAA